MLRRTGASDEGMQQDRSGGRKIGQTAGARARLLRAALGIALAGLVVSLDTSTVRAADDDTTNESAWNKFMQKLGLKKPPGDDSDINYTERSPLVVPPSRDLPPPAAAAAMPASDWPKDPKKQVNRAKAKGAIIADTAVQTPNPPVVKKPWYDPRGWFDKEEYANFKGEPVRANLTDPPAGYRIPSPTQPYGIGPDKKSTTTAGNRVIPPGAPVTPPATPAQPTAAPTATPPAPPVQPTAAPTGAPPESQAGK